MEEDEQGFSEAIIWPAEIVRQLAPAFETSTTGMARRLGMSRHRVWRQIHRRQQLSTEDQQRVLGAIRVYVASLKLCGYSTPEQRTWARRWMNDWLRTPNLYFEGQYPLSYLCQSREEDRLVIYLLQLRYGVYT
tara:strand:+ start:1910 stop:2311 length:402 start_codon:yes stop_codon:yes gene_type:complete